MADPIPPPRSSSPPPTTSSPSTASSFLLIVMIVMAFVLISGGGLTILTGTYVELIQRIYSWRWDSFLRIMKYIFFFADVLFLTWLVISIRGFVRLNRTLITNEVPAEIPRPEDEVRPQWEGIMELTASAHPSDWNMAILRADALLEDVLTHLGYEGATLAERLKIVDPTKLPSMERIWSAHRVRNMIAHDPVQEHTRETITHAIASYEQAFKELGMMQNAKIT